jgi:hypothetical protein
MNLFTREQVHEMGSVSIATLVDFVRKGHEPYMGNSARLLLTLEHLVRKVRPADAAAIFAEAASLALTEVIDEYRRRYKPHLAPRPGEEPQAPAKGPRRGPGPRNEPKRARNLCTVAAARPRGGPDGS